MNESHIQHTVSFIEHEVTDFVKMSGAAVHQVDQSSRCGDNDIGLLQFLYLHVDGNAAVHRRYTKMFSLREFDKLIRDLHGKLASGREDKRDGSVLSVDLFDERHRKAQCFAGAGLGLRDNVASFKDCRDNFLLDGRRLGNAVLFQLADHTFAEL